MARIDVKVEGVEKTLASLKKWQIIKRQACEDVLKEVGLKIERAAKLNHRGKGPTVQTARLIDSISTNWSGSGMDRAQARGKAKRDDTVGQPPGPKGLVVVVGTNVKYAHMQEFGSWGPGDYPAKGESVPLRRESTKRPFGGFQFLTTAKITHEADLQKRIAEVMKKD